MANPTKRIRSNESYVIEAAQKVLQVLEHLQGQQYAPVSVAEMAKRSGFNYDFCRRALRTLFAAGWAVETERGWQLSVKAGHFSEGFFRWAASLPHVAHCDKCGNAIPLNTKRAEFPTGESAKPEIKDLGE